VARFTFEVVEDLARSIREAQQFQPGEEVGGLLFGQGDPVLLVRQGRMLPNVAGDRYREWSASAESIAPTIAHYETVGLELVGSWHTHPFGSTNLSRADAQLNHSFGPLLLLVAAPLEVDRGRWEWRVHREQGSSPREQEPTILPPRHVRL